jgi:hypothetical protein
LVVAETVVTVVRVMTGWHYWYLLALTVLVMEERAVTVMSGWHYAKRAIKTRELGGML